MTANDLNYILVIVKKNKSAYLCYKSYLHYHLF